MWKRKLKKYKPKGNFNKYIIVFIIIIACIAGAIAVAPMVERYMSHGVEEKVYRLVNEDRATYGVSPIMWNGKLSNLAYSRAVEVANADLMNERIPYMKGYTREDIFIVSVDDFERRYYYSPQFTMDKWRNTNYQFRLNELNRDNVYVGIGVAKSLNNYYVVFEWSDGVGVI